MITSIALINCQKEFHTKEECFVLHPELLEAFRAKTARKTTDKKGNKELQNHTVAMVESKQGATIGN